MGISCRGGANFSDPIAGEGDSRGLSFEGFWAPDPEQIRRSWPAVVGVLERPPSNKPLGTDLALLLGQPVRHRPDSLSWSRSDVEEGTDIEKIQEEE